MVNIEVQSTQQGIDVYRLFKKFLKPRPKT